MLPGIRELGILAGASLSKSQNGEPIADYSVKKSAKAFLCAYNISYFA